MTKLVIEKLTVKSSRIVCDVRVDAPGVSGSTGAPRAQTSPQLIRGLLGRFPTLLSHACVNDEGETFAAVADHTSLPHLLEHLVIAMQVEAEIALGVPTVSSHTYVGTTEWVDRACAKARVEVNYRDDLVALRSFSEAVALINSLL